MCVFEEYKQSIWHRIAMFCALPLSSQREVNSSTMLHSVVHSMKERAATTSDSSLLDLTMSIKREFLTET